MASTLYVDFQSPPVLAAWLNDLNRLQYTILGNPQTASDFRIALGTFAIVSGGTGATTKAGAQAAFAGDVMSAAVIAAPYSFPSGVSSPVIFDTKDFDTGNFYSTVTGRFTPTVSGYYSITGNLFITSSGSPNNMFASLCKNGVETNRGSGVVNTAGSNIVAGLLFFNGTTDYATINAYNNGTAPSVFNASICRFTAAFVRP